jgi:hypothetical protein
MRYSLSYTGTLTCQLSALGEGGYMLLGALAFAGLALMLGRVAMKRS